MEQMIYEAIDELFKDDKYNMNEKQVINTKTGICEVIPVTEDIKIIDYSDDIDRECRYLRGYVLGVGSELSYDKAIECTNRLYGMCVTDIDDIVESIEKIHNMENNPGSFIGMNDEELAELAAEESESGELYKVVVYAKQLIKRNHPLGYILYGDLLGEQGYFGKDYNAARICYAKAGELLNDMELGNNVHLIYIISSYEEEDNIPQARRWAEKALELGAEESVETWEWLKENYERCSVWNSNEPISVISIPEGYFDGIIGKKQVTKSISSQEEIDDIASYFEGFVGMEKVKAQIEKIYNTVKLQARRDAILRERGEEPAQNEKGYNFVLLGNPGTGKTTVARIIAKILYDIEVRERETLIEVERSRIVSNHIGETGKQMRNILDEVAGGTLFIDEAYTLYKEDSESDFGQEAIDTLMKDMEDNRDSYSVIIAGYREPMLNMIRKSNSGFRSRFTYLIEIPDYTDEELIKMAHMHIERMKYQLEDGVDDAIKKNILHDRIDETFGNARYIRELVNRAVENQAERLNKQGEMSEQDIFTLKAEDFWQDNSEEKTVEQYLEELDSMTGLDGVKEEVKALVNRITVMAEMEKRGLDVSDDYGTLHMVFKGNPGTGKTTVARLLGKIYSALGVLKRGDVFVECNRGKLVGKYQGHTADNVNNVVKSAMGGILFIDEAYALSQGENDSFGQEAIDTLVSEMENNRNRLMVILAGYSDEMDRFMERNQGLKSRIPNEIVFEDYDGEDLLEIAIKMLTTKKMNLDENAVEPLRALLAERMKTEDFGNARGARNIVDEIIRNQNIRIAGVLRTNPELISDEELVKITEGDIY
ncbi:MAG: AAA family ATPase [Lachnospiraceae bacterium]|nr:AAA family ATPase [Lachnospiraceae bacterium]